MLKKKSACGFKPEELVTTSLVLLAGSVNNRGAKQQYPSAPLDVSLGTALHSMDLETVGLIFPS